MSFGLPPGTEPPPAPQPKAGGDWWPHVIGQVQQDDGTMLVTFAGPRLSQLVVRVPLTAWIEGEHSKFMSSTLPFWDIVFPQSHVPIDAEEDTG